MTAAIRCVTAATGWGCGAKARSLRPTPGSGEVFWSVVLYTSPEPCTPSRAASPCRRTLTDPSAIATARIGPQIGAAETAVPDHRGLVFLVARLPVARAARDAGFDVVVATRVRDHGDRIRTEGFALRPLAWRRSGDGPFGASARDRRDRPALPPRAAGHRPPCRAEGDRVRRRSARVWHSALGTGAPARVAAVMGLGAVSGRRRGAAGRASSLWPCVLRRVMRSGRVTVREPRRSRDARRARHRRRRGSR